MATKLKKKGKNSPAKKTEKTYSKTLKADKDEKVDWKALARDERTWKIVGAVSLLASILFLLPLTFSPGRRIRPSPSRDSPHYWITTNQSPTCSAVLAQ